MAESGPRSGGETPRVVDPELISPTSPRAQLTRRKLLKYTGLIGAAGLLEAKGLSLVSSRRISIEAETDIVEAVVTRRLDMLSLRFEFRNFNLVSGPARLVRAHAGDAFMVVHFEPQAIGEEALEEYENDPPLPTPPVQSRLAGPSRIAFRIPDNISEMPYNLQNLLNWDPYTLNVVPVARTPGQYAPKFADPLPEETAIEAPWRLIVSPHEGHKWRHKKAPFTNANRTELWHTTLHKPGAINPENGEELPTPADIHAVWTPGSVKRHNPPDGSKPFDRTAAPADGDRPFVMSLNDFDRWNIIRLTSDYKNGNQLTPKPAKAKLFMLSPLGAWIDLRGDWNPNKDLGLSVEHWTHRTVMARDNFVKVIYRGYLFPFGHRAVLIKTTERKFEVIGKDSQKGSTAAFLRVRKFIVVREPIKKYDNNDFPFTSVRILSLSTPILDPPKDDAVYGDEMVFWPRVGQHDFLFHMLGIDKDGQEIDFTAPILFVRQDAEPIKLARDLARNAYKAEKNLSRRQRSMGSQEIALAPSSSAKPGDARLETKNLEFRGKPLDSGEPRWRPVVVSANVRLKAVEEVKGPGVGNQDVEYHPTYLSDGFAGKNANALVFVRLKKPVKLDFGKDAKSDRSGGVSSPNMDISGLSRKTGPMGGDLSGENMPSKFKPEKFFEGASILGGIDLADILKAANFTGFDKAPALVSRPIYPGNNKSQPPEKIETVLTWKVQGNELKPDGAGIFQPIANDSLELTAKFTTPVTGGDPDYEIFGEIRNFKVNMIGSSSPFLILTFNKLTFTSRKGKSPDVDVDIDKVEFAGVLTFVNELKDFMNFGGSGLSIDISPTQIEASYTLEIPTISVGIFSLQHLSLFAGVIIPFTGKPVSAKFGFCRQDAQFLLTYTIFGGGGFVELTVGADEDSGKLSMEKLQIGLEFGASASIDIGVASGGVHIMAGIDFTIGKDDNDCAIAELSGYIRLGGELDILGIISMSLEFKMSLTYDFADDVVWGQATLVVEIDVLMFSASVDLTVEKKFGGGTDTEDPCASTSSLVAGPVGELVSANSTPTPIHFSDLMDQETWSNDYAAAFAPAAFV